MRSMHQSRSAPCQKAPRCSRQCRRSWSSSRRAIPSSTVWPSECRKWLFTISSSRAGQVARSSTGTKITPPPFSSTCPDQSAMTVWNATTEKRCTVLLVRQMNQCEDQKTIGNARNSFIIARTASEEQAHGPQIALHGQSGRRLGAVPQHFRLQETSHACCPSQAFCTPTRHTCFLPFP